jgi:hypothetical protein
MRLARCTIKHVAPSLQFSVALAFLLLPEFVFAAAERQQQLKGYVPDVVSRLTPVGRVAELTPINLVIGLPSMADWPPERSNGAITNIRRLTAK